MSLSSYNRVPLAFFVFVCFVVFSTSCSESSSVQAHPSDTSIVFIFHQPPAFEPLPFQMPGNGSYTPPRRIFTLSYINESGLTTYVANDERQEKVDTLVLYPASNWMSVAHDFHSIETWPFYVKRGDTVHFTYEGERPIAEVVNRPTLPYDVNYEWLKRQALGIDTISPESKRDNPHFVMAYHRKHPGRTVPESVAAFERDINREIRTHLQLERKFLDSVRAQGAISLAAFDFFSEALRYDSLTQAIFEGKGTGYQGTHFAIYDSTALHHAAFHRAWRTYLIYDLRRHMPTFRRKNRFQVDYRAMFDSVARSPVFAGKVRELALHFCLGEICKGFSIEDREEYVAKFQQQSTDSILLHQIYDQYRLDQPVTSTLYLEDLAGTADSLQSVIAATPGKVLYVDFWASWCAPCLRAMPDAAKLRKRLAGEEVAFAYISLDENPDAWAKASQRLGFDSLSHNYRITNRRTSLFLEDMDISSIPRYLIYDQAGNMVYPQAPGPDDERIEEILRALAQQE